MLSLSNQSGMAHILGERQDILFHEDCVGQESTGEMAHLGFAAPADQGEDDARMDILVPKETQSLKKHSNQGGVGRVDE